jgi:hypothetical protein
VVYFVDKSNLNSVEGLDLMEFEEGSIAINHVAYWYFFQLSCIAYSFCFFSFPSPFSYSIIFIFQVHSL